MPKRVKRISSDAPRQGRDPSDNFTLELFPTTVIRGGLQGGREQAQSDKPWLVTSHVANGEVIFTTSLPGLHEPQEYGPFWSYWTTDTAVQQAQAWNEAMRCTAEWWCNPPDAQEL